MRAMNLYLLTRTAESRNFSLLAKELSGETHYKAYGSHEAGSLRALTDLLAPLLEERAKETEKSWISYLDGFYFSYTIAHISKEFDLLKISKDAGCVLNIELKSEAIEEERISRQLAQNRYYLSHISGTIYSYTYVMETNTLYSLNDKGYMRICSPQSLADVLCRPAFTEYVEKDPDQYFRAANYLISPVTAPEKYLQGSYFLTNQQAEFRRKIMETLAQKEGSMVPVIIVTGTAGTGKTLLLFDAAMELSKKRKVLLLHGGRLQNGHRIIDERLRNVSIREAGSFQWKQEYAEEYSYFMADEANRVRADLLNDILTGCIEKGIPCIMAYDPHHLTGQDVNLAETESVMEQAGTLFLEFTGNIRINRSVYLFMRALFNRRELNTRLDFDCVDILFAKTRAEAETILSYYREIGYFEIALPGSSESIGNGVSPEEIVGQEYDYVTIILDRRFYYDEEMHLRAFGNEAEAALTVLYEGLSHAREKVCLLVFGDEDLFAEILSIKER